MYTSGLLVALVGLFPSSIRSEPSWLEDYSQAYRQCQKAEKPLAVFLGSGAKGWNRLSRDGQLSPENKELLSKNYVCLYIDTTQEAGQELARAFEMPNHLGVVISDSSGQVQAFRHEGEVQAAELTRYLRRYADPQRIVSSTETNPSAEPVVRTSRYVEPAYEAPTYVAPSHVAPSYSSFRGGRGC
jgi:hypothetical protein